MGKIKTPMICEIAKKTYAINEFGMAAVYLLVGDTRAMLIDTGVGYLDLDKIVSGLTSLPYDVVITHAHGDHVGGMHQFDRVYMHEKDWEMAQRFEKSFSVNYAKKMGAMGTFNTFDFDVDAPLDMGKNTVFYQ